MSDGRSRSLPDTSTGSRDGGGERMGDLEALSGGELNAAVTREVTRVHTDVVGRGPTKSYSFHNGSVLITVMLEVMSKAERSLVADGEEETVLAMRRAAQRTMADGMTAAVEDLTGSSVTAFMCDNHLDPDMAVEVFILDPPLT
jgi:uncharacterized protein YbcI